jgi:hypothetical protein
MPTAACSTRYALHPLLSRFLERREQDVISTAMMPITTSSRRAESARAPLVCSACDPPPGTWLPDACEMVFPNLELR